MNKEDNAQGEEIVEVISLFGKAMGRPSYRYPVAVKATEAHLMLDEAYALTNHDNRTNADRLPATSPGDILIARDQPYLVCGMGFKLITPAEMQALIAADMEDTMKHLVHALSLQD